MTDHTLETPALSVPQKITYSIPSMALNLSGAVLGGWLLYFYRPPDDAVAQGRVPLVSLTAWFVATIVGRVLDALSDPLVGHWSDRCRSRMGRRLPFILWGTPLLAITFGMLWFPPFAPGSIANDLYFIGIFSAYWLAFTAVVAPYLSLLPEIAPGDNERVVTSSVMAVFTVLGMAAGGVLPGVLNEAFPHGGTLAGLGFDNGFQLAGAIAAVVILVFFLTPLINIRERPFSAEKEVPPGLFSAVKGAFRNPAFRTYLAIAAFLQMGLNIVIAIVPYLSKAVLERPPTVPQALVEGVIPASLRAPIWEKLPTIDGIVPYGSAEGFAGALQGGVVVGAALMIVFVNLLHRKLGKKRLLILAGYVFGAVLALLPAIGLFPDPALPTIVMFALLTVPVSAALVLPNAVFADVVDYDAGSSGVRREGIYNGATALLTKLAIGGAQLLAAALLVLGSSRLNPLGVYVCLPVGAALIILGVFLFRKHPIEK